MVFLQVMLHATKQHNASVLTDAYRIKSPSMITATQSPSLLAHGTSTRSPDRGASSPESLVRVLHLVNGEHFSGAERVQQLLGKNLPLFGVEPWFACLKPGKFEACCGLDPSTVFTEEMHGRADLGVVARMAHRLRTNPPSLLHAHTPRSALVAGLLAKRLDIPWIYHVHSPTARDSTRAWINRVNDWVEGWALRSASHIITVSKSLRREMLRRGYSRYRLTKVANGVATHESITTLDRMEQREWRLGMVALVRPRKGIEVLLEAMKQIQSIKPQVTLDVIGGFETEEYQREVLALSDRLNLGSHVRWLGFSKDVPSRIRELDALVLPSLFGEGMPMVVLEAMALGVPVVATTVEGTPEVVRHGIEGYLAEPRDASSLANAILKMVDDRLVWHRLSANAWERQRALFSDRAMAETVAKVYRRALNVL